jgi:hypothetical protein
MQELDVSGDNLQPAFALRRHSFGASATKATAGKPGALGLQPASDKNGCALA